MSESRQDTTRDVTCDSCAAAGNFAAMKDHYCLDPVVPRSEVDALRRERDELQLLIVHHSSERGRLEKALRELVDHFDDERPDVTDWRYDLHETLLPRARAALAESRQEEET